MLSLINKDESEPLNFPLTLLFKFLSSAHHVHLILLNRRLTAHPSALQLRLQLGDLLGLQGGRLQLKIERIRNVADHVAELEDADALLELLVQL